MSRQIIVDEAHQDGQEAGTTEQNIISEGTQAQGSTFLPTVGQDSVLISSDEMDRLFHEWDANGKNDLYINPTMAERIRQYLAYQEELDPLKAKLAERIYKPYLVTPDRSDDYSNVNIKINNSDALITTSAYILANYYKAIPVVSFKAILVALRNPYALYIPNTPKQYVDFLAYVIANGGEWKFSSNTYSITL